MKSPSIMFLNRVFPPDTGATGEGISRVARSFLEAGWSVTVIVLSSCGTGVAHEDGVKVIRIPAVSPSKSLPLRALSIAVGIPLLFLRALREPPADIVVTMTDPPMQFLLGPLLRMFQGCRFIHWAHDLYPDVAVRAGVLPARGLIPGFLDVLSRKALCSHDRIIAVGRCMRDLLVSRGVSSSKIAVIPNSWAGAGIVPLPREQSLLGELGLVDRFTVMYSGNLGRAHDFETVLSAAGILREQGDERFVFLFSGDGPGAVLLKSEVRRLGLTNVRFLPRCDDSKLSLNLASGDAHLVTMRPEMKGVVVPSKYYGVVAAGRPCLFIGPAGSEIARSLGELGNGIRIEPGDAAALVEALRRFDLEPVWKERAACAAAGFDSVEVSGKALVRVAGELLSGRSSPSSQTAIP